MVINITWYIQNSWLTSLCDRSDVEGGLSIGKLFRMTYLMEKFDDISVLIPMWNSLIFPTAVCKDAAWSVACIFMFWEAWYALRSTKSSAMEEKDIASMLPVSSVSARGSLNLLYWYNVSNVTNMLVWKFLKTFLRNKEVT